MRFDLANLPNNIATLHRIITSQATDVASEREARAAREAELATAKAGLIAKTLEIEKLKLQLARLRRAQFGRSSEKIARTIEQFELMLEDLEADTPAPAATPDASAAEPSHHRGQARARSLGASRWPSICRAATSYTSRAAPAPHAAARCARWVRT
jgi:hypothetical protein